jgi:hypothetical protein
MDHPSVTKWIEKCYAPDSGGHVWLPRECLIETAAGSLVVVMDPPDDVKEHLRGPEARKTTPLPVYCSIPIAS